MAQARTNFTGNKEVTFDHNDLTLLKNHPTAQARTNFRGVNETPMVFNNIHLKRNHPTATVFTNAQMQGGAVYQQDASYNYLPPTVHRGGFEGRPGVPSIQGAHPVKSLIRVR